MVVTPLVIFKGEEDTDLLQRIGEFRLRVWCGLIDAAVARQRFRLDQFDYAGWHVADLRDGEIVGCGRLCGARAAGEIPDSCSFGPYLDQMRYPVGVLNRLAIHPEFCGNGLSRRVVSARVELACELGFEEVWVEAQRQRVVSMQRLGFEDKGASSDTSVDGEWRILRKKTAV